MTPALTALCARVPMILNGQPSPIRIEGMTRADLPSLFASLGFTRGAEIGVYAAEFTAQLCDGNPKGHVLAVDPWLRYPAYRDNLEKRIAALPKREEEARARLATRRATIVKAMSAEAAKDVPLASLDYVFIDGNHAYEYVLEDLTLWSDRVKPGGIVSGHDYHEFTRIPYRKIQVIRAVDEFTRTHAIHPWFLMDRGTYLWVRP